MAERRAVELARGRSGSRLISTSRTARPIVALARLALASALCVAFMPSSRRIGPLTTSSGALPPVLAEQTVQAGRPRRTSPASAVATTGKDGGRQPAMTASQATFSAVSGRRRTVSMPITWSRGEAATRGTRARAPRSGGRWAARRVHPVARVALHRLERASADAIRAEVLVTVADSGQPTRAPRVSHAASVIGGPAAGVWQDPRPMVDEPEQAGPDRMRVAGAQIENVVGDLDGNAARILDAMRWAEEQERRRRRLPRAGADRLPARRPRAARGVRRRRARRRSSGSPASSGRDRGDRGHDRRASRRAARGTRASATSRSAPRCCATAQLRGMYHKVLLPNYEVFDEARNFAPGDEPGRLWRIGPAVAGIAICEDLWSGDGPPEAQAAAGARILLVPNASPFHQEKPAGRLALASRGRAAQRRARSSTSTRVGGQDDLVFDGGSLVVDADGELLYRARQFEPERFCVDVPLGAARPLTGAGARRSTRARRDCAPPAAAAASPPAGERRRAGVEGARGRHARLRAPQRRDDRRARPLRRDRRRGDRRRRRRGARPRERARRRDARPRRRPPRSSRTRASSPRALGIELRRSSRSARVTDVVERAGSPAARRASRPGHARRARRPRARRGAVDDRPTSSGTCRSRPATRASCRSARPRCTATWPARSRRSRTAEVAALPARRPAQRSAAASSPQRVLERTPTIKPTSRTLAALLRRARPDRRALPGARRGARRARRRRASTPRSCAACCSSSTTPSSSAARRRPGAKITSRAFGQDLRMPITNAWRPFRADEAELVPPGRRSPTPGRPPSPPASATDYHRRRDVRHHRTLATHATGLRYEELPPEVSDQAAAARRRPDRDRAARRRGRGLDAAVRGAVLAIAGDGDARRSARAHARAGRTPRCSTGRSRTASTSTTRTATARVHPGAAVIPVVLALAEQHGIGGTPRDRRGRRRLRRDLPALDGDRSARRTTRAASTRPRRSACSAPPRPRANLLGLSADGARARVRRQRQPGRRAACSSSRTAAGTSASHPGFAAHDAILALELARHGFDGLERAVRGTARLLRGYSRRRARRSVAVGRPRRALGDPAHGGQAVPGVPLRHAPLDILLDLVAEHGPAGGRGRGGDDRRVARPAWTSSARRSSASAASRSVVDGQFSMPFLAAVALLRGRMTWSDYDLVGVPERSRSRSG